MADKIRIWIEESMPDFMALYKKGIFTQEEIKDILNNREKLEYVL
jgi:hypothetical protein